MKALALRVAVTAAACHPRDRPVAGPWIGQFEGTTFLRLELETTNGTISGGLASGHFQLDREGAVRRVDQSPRDLTPIFDVAQRGSTVTFSRKDSPESGTDRFELRLLDAGRAELHFLLSDADRRELAANGVPAPKPIALITQ